MDVFIACMESVLGYGSCYEDMWMWDWAYDLLFDLILAHCKRIKGK
jgi:hypothetical protein